MIMEITLPLADLFEAFASSNFMGQFIVVLQIAASIVVWTVMIGRFLELSTKEKDVIRFRRSFSSSRYILDGFLKGKKFFDPMGKIYMDSCDSLISQIAPDSPTLPSSAAAVEGCRISNASIELVKGVAEESLSARQMELDHGMTILALGSSLTPLIGLLGTVWGILDAFQAMGAKGSALLSDVAPGLSSALLTTVVGLFVAIPSAIGYNIILGRIRRVSAMLDGFTDEFIARMSGEFGRNDR